MSQVLQRTQTTHKKEGLLKSASRGLGNGRKDKEGGKLGDREIGRESRGIGRERGE